MKLLFVTQNEAPFRMKWMDALAEYMDVTVYHLNDYENHVNKKYINYYTKKAVVEDISRLIFTEKIFKLTKVLKNNYDILLLDGYGFFAQQILIVVLLIFRKQFGMSIDGGFIPKQENILKKKVKSFFISNATFYLSTSNETDNYLLYYGVKRERIYRHLFSNVSLDDILEAPITSKEKSVIRKNLCLDDKFTVIAVGNIIEIKGFDILIEALKHIKEDIQVLIVGSGNDEKIIKMIDSCSKVKHVEFVEKEILNEYYKASDVFVLPTRGDVWGLVIGEAMAKGLPVITTDMCLAGKAMIDNTENGYIIPTENKLALNEAINNILHADIYRMGRKSIEIIREYSLEQSAMCDNESLKEIIDELL